MITFLKEIAARDKMGLTAVFNGMELEKMLTDTDLDPVNQANLFFSHVYAHRFPVYASHQSRIKTLIHSLKLETGIRLSPPDNPDGQAYTLTFTAKNKEEFKRRSQDVAAIADHPSIQELFRA